MDERHETGPGSDRRTRVAVLFLAISYGVAAPVTLFVELRDRTLSVRFDLPPELIWVVCAVQVLCAAAILVPRLAPWSAAVLSIITAGAAGSHLRMGSPLAAVPALVYTAVQVWLVAHLLRRPEADEADAPAPDDAQPGGSSSARSATDDTSSSRPS